MLYLITGNPGSGKTLYTVSTLLQKLAAEKVKGKDGALVPRRLVIDGIKGLAIPHEMMTAGVEDAEGNLLPAAEGDGVWNWPDWCKPGDVIVIDEVQRWWRPRGMGAKPPREIKALETHRHMGVDFVIVTQNPMLLDQNVRRLVGRHQHVRRMLGMQRAVIYDWDSCQSDPSRTKLAAVSMWNYPKSAYKLYQSSQLHTKQRQKIPAWVAIPVLAIVGLAFIAPKAFAVLTGAMGGKGVSTVAAAPVPVYPPPVVSITSSSPPLSPASAVVVVPSVAAASAPLEPVQIAGCMSLGPKCICSDAEGGAVDVKPGFCESKILGYSQPGQKTVDVSGVLPAYNPPPAPASAGDLEVLAFMATHRRGVSSY